MNTPQAALNLAQTMLQSDAFKVLQDRLHTVTQSLFESTNILNTQRTEVFGQLKNELIHTINAHTSQNGVAVELAFVNQTIVMGSHVVLGLKSQLELSDVFNIFSIDLSLDTPQIKEVPLSGSFLQDPAFQKAFDNLMRYYKDASLYQMVQKENSFYIAFKTGKDLKDLKTFEWRLNSGSFSYLGECSSKIITSAFEAQSLDWTATTRSHFVLGKYPHISILDKVFIETIGGTLTIKVENNTQTGAGIYEEPVENKIQKLEDAKCSYLTFGDLILLRILPYQEKHTRYFIFNTLTNQVLRADGVGTSCTPLPEGQGFIFSNGYYLTSGEFKIFDAVDGQFYFHKAIASPNGEDYLYVFYDFSQAKYVLYTYNIVTKTIQTPLFTNGFALSEQGILFTLNPKTEASHIHTIQAWKTAFISQQTYLQSTDFAQNSFFQKVGNANLVRALSDISTILELCQNPKPSISLFEGIIKYSQQVIDNYFWLDKPEAQKLSKHLQQLHQTSVLVIEEFEKIQALERQSAQLLNQAEDKHLTIIKSAQLLNSKSLDKYIQELMNLKSHLGHLISLRSERYIDINKIDHLQIQVKQVKESLNERFLQVLIQPDAFSSYIESIDQFEQQITTFTKNAQFIPIEKSISSLQDQINTINDEVGQIDFDDPTLVASILDTLSAVFSKINQLKARIQNIKQSFGSHEASQKFGAQIKLMSQSLTSALALCNTQSDCDQQLSRILNQLDSQEAQFVDFAQYQEELARKRVEILDAFEHKKEQIKNQLARRVSSLEQSARLTLTSIENKSKNLSTLDQLNSFFASDSLVLKLQENARKISDLGASTISDSLLGQLKYISESTLRTLRDTQDIFEDNGSIMKMGSWRFSVNQSPIEISIIEHLNQPSFHISTTDFYLPISDDFLTQYRHLELTESIAESPTLYRSTYLAVQVFQEYLHNEHPELQKAVEQHNHSIISGYFTQRITNSYQENYIKGIHDHDASLIFQEFVHFHHNAKDLAIAPQSRLLALLSKEYLLQVHSSEPFLEDYVKACEIFAKIGSSSRKNRIETKIKQSLEDFLQLNTHTTYSRYSKKAAEYFLTFSPEHLICCQQEAWIQANHIYEFLGTSLPTIVNLEDVKDVQDICHSFFHTNNQQIDASLLDEVVIGLICLQKQIKIQEVSLTSIRKISSLLGQHPLIINGSMQISYHDTLDCVQDHREHILPLFKQLSEKKLHLLQQAQQQFSIKDFKPKPIASFVRNKLISESYFNLIGANLAKQIGSIGETKRSDFMGMLLLISPPGYGKTTIVEYIAQKLGMIFVKINCPSLNHSIVSLDPNEAKDATSKKEIEKLNLAFEMGNNVLLYLDDIQHTNPEFLQKFISLCDANRKIDGVFNGNPKTYDLKGKKFAIVMAGNPYTESGTKFKIPDMLANRADIYNLGDILSGQQNAFELSYLENALTSHPILTPLSTRSMQDVYLFIDKAKGLPVSLNDLVHPYSSTQTDEIVQLLRHMLHIQKVILKVNQQYILSAAQDTKYRTEPPFKLQGSYRNMSKITEKISANMSTPEVDRLILDHYQAESQTLTQGSEENMLKLRQILDILTPEQQQRWEHLTQNFIRLLQNGDQDMDGLTKIANQISLLHQTVQNRTFDSSGT